MKKQISILAFGIILFSCGLKAFSQQTLVYNGGSGPQIPVTYQGSYLTIGDLPNDYPQLRVDWILSGGGIYSEIYYPGASFIRYANYNFRISGNAWYIPSSGYFPFPNEMYSDSYYIFN